MDFDEIYWRGRDQPGTNEFNLGDDPDHRPNPGVRSPKSGFTGLSIMLTFDGGLRSLVVVINAIIATHGARVLLFSVVISFVRLFFCWSVYLFVNTITP